ncbi:MAG: tetratricopeptide repeat protein [Acidobacteriota bacterium]
MRARLHLASLLVAIVAPAAAQPAPSSEPPAAAESAAELAVEEASSESVKEPGGGSASSLTPAWAAERTNLGNALLEQARRVEGESSRQLLAQAIIAYRSALEVFNSEEHPRLWAATLNNLGSALEALGAITQGEAGDKLLDSAIAAHRSALEVFTREATPQDWAMTHDHIGAALYARALRAEQLERPLLLHEALVAHRRALEVLTLESSPEPWSLARLNEAQVLRASGKPAEAAEALRQALAQNPDDRVTLLQLVGLLQDELYDHRGALQTVNGWLQRFPEDTLVAVRSIEPLFSLGRVEEALFLARHLQPRAERSGDLQSVLRAYEVATLLARKKLDAAAEALIELQKLVESRPEGWQPLWPHAGTRRYLSRADLPHQGVIVALFEAVEKPKRIEALGGLRVLASQLGLPARR